MAKSLDDSYTHSRSGIKKEILGTGGEQEEKFTST